MKDEDWKQVLVNWYKSKKLIELKKKIMDNKMKHMNEQQMFELMTEIFEYSMLTEEEKQSTDWIDQELIDMTTKMIVLESLVKTLTRWYTFQVFYEEKELYEVAQHIQDTIEIEIEEARRLIRTYFLVDDTDEELYESICINCREMAYETHAQK